MLVSLALDRNMKLSIYLTINSGSHATGKLL